MNECICTYTLTLNISGDPLSLLLEFTWTGALPIKLREGHLNSTARQGAAACACSRGVSINTYCTHLPHHPILHAYHFSFHIKLSTSHMQTGKGHLPGLWTVYHVPGLVMTWTPEHGSIPHCLIPTYLCATRSYLNPISSSEHYRAFTWFYCLFLYSKKVLFPL